MVDVPDQLSDAMIAKLPADLLEEISSRLGFEVHQVQIELIGRFSDPQAELTPSSNRGSQLPPTGRAE